MKPLHKALILAALHVLIVSSLGAKLLIDRQTRPRVWVRTAPIDPNDPFRGRYVRLGLEVPAEGATRADDKYGFSARLEIRNGNLVAVRDKDSMEYVRWQGETSQTVVLSEPVAFFIPEHVPDPSRRNPGEELWVEVTLPRRGPPRPIQLGVKKAGVLTPLRFN
jgi:hypothetical protein